MDDTGYDTRARLIIPAVPRPDTAEEKATPNFLVIARGPDGAVKMTLTISEFKTKCAKFPRSVRELPAAFFIVHMCTQR